MDSEIIFEGEYLNGKIWNGKEYNNKNIVYEIKNGKGYYKLYCGTHLIVEGEYLNGELNWKVKEYDEVGNLCYEWEYKADLRNGKG